MKGFYFINTDIRNTRAHTCQTLNTTVAINNSLSVDIVAPKYHDELNLEIVKQRHGILITPSMVFLRNFGVGKPGVVAFALFNIPTALFLFIRKIKKEVDFIYIRSSLFLPLVVFAYMFRIPVFFETHRKPLSLSERRRDYIISKIATGIIVISDYMREHYLPYKKRILVAHDAVSLQRFTVTTDKNKAREKLGLELGKNICVYTGTVSKLKGLDNVFATAKVLFLIVGQVSPEFTDVNLPPNVRLLGKKEQRELPLIIQAADVLLLPHPKGEYSQSPMKLFEYMASGRPIVASNLPSISEILDNKNSVLVEAGDKEALAFGIKKVLENKDFSNAIAKKAYEDVKNHTWESRGTVISEFIKDTYESL